MNPLSAIIVDDEHKIRDVLHLKLQQYCPDVRVVGLAGNITQAKDLIKSHQPDVVFLDISMAGGSGFDLISEIEIINFEVIFVTGFNDFALDALKVSAVDYLLKPVNTDELTLAVAKTRTRIRDRHTIEMYHNLKHNLDHLGDQDTRIAIPGVRHYDFVMIKEIVRCEGWQKYTRIYLTDGTQLLSSYNIGVFRKMLDSYGFFNCHKSHLINIHLIDHYQVDGEVVMKNGECVPLARRRKQAFQEIVMAGVLRVGGKDGEE